MAKAVVRTEGVGEALGSYAHAYLLEREAEPRGIRVERDAGWHFEYTRGRT